MWYPLKGGRFNWRPIGGRWSIDWFPIFSLSLSYFPFFILPVCFLFSFLLFFGCWQNSHTLPSILRCVVVAEYCWSIFLVFCFYSFFSLFLSPSRLQTPISLMIDRSVWLLQAGRKRANKKERERSGKLEVRQQQEQQQKWTLNFFFFFLTLNIKKKNQANVSSPTCSFSNGSY